MLCIILAKETRRMLILFQLCCENTFSSSCHITDVENGDRSSDPLEARISSVVVVVLRLICLLVLPG